MQQSFEKQPVEDGEPVFDAPWQARSFAMAVKLNEAGIFSWNEWAEALSENIRIFEEHSAIENSDHYYKLWQKTLESLVENKAL